MRRLSQIQIRAFQACTQKWKQRYVEGPEAETESGDAGETS
jgi:hypothetical protein